MLQWKRKSNYHAVSTKGDYVICWAMVKGEWVYTAWAPGRWYAFNHQPMGDFRGEDAAEQAKACCVEHFEKQQGEVTHGGGVGTAHG